MRHENEFLNNFFREHIGFFSKPLPDEEEKFDFYYSSATADWQIIRFEASNYKIEKQTLSRLGQLFNLAENFLYSLKGSTHPYNRAIIILQEQWQEIRNLASSFKHFC